MAIFNSLGDEGINYSKIASKQLVGMLIIVLVHQKHKDAISEISSEYVGCGILGMMGNKGGVGVRLRLYDSYLTFINSHLAAEASFIERRNQDYAEVCKRMQFKTHYPSLYEYYLANPWVATANDCGVHVYENSPAGAALPPVEGRCTLFDSE